VIYNAITSLTSRVPGRVSGYGGRQRHQDRSRAWLDSSNPIEDKNKKAELPQR